MDLAQAAVLGQDDFDEVEDELFEVELLESEEEEVELEPVLESLEPFESLDFEAPSALEEEFEDSDPELAPAGTLESVT